MKSKILTLLCIAMVLLLMSVMVFANDGDKVATPTESNYEFDYELGTLTIKTLGSGMSYELYKAPEATEANLISPTGYTFQYVIETYAGENVYMRAIDPDENDPAESSDFLTIQVPERFPAPAKPAVFSKSNTSVTLTGDPNTVLTDAYSQFGTFNQEGIVTRDGLSANTSYTVKAYKAGSGSGNDGHFRSEYSEE